MDGQPLNIECAVEFRADLGRHGRGARARIDVAEQHQEFVATGAGDDILEAHRAGQAPAHLGKQQIARRMTQGVIDDLEAVEIDGEDRKAAVTPLRPADFLAEAL